MMEISKNMIISDLLKVDPDIEGILLASGMHCLGCVMAHGEDLEQACAVHGIDADELVKDIKEYLANKNKAK